MLAKYWMSNSRMTFQVNVRDGVITWSAPIGRKFIGQPLSNLERWMGVKGVDLANGHSNIRHAAPG